MFNIAELFFLLHINSFFIGEYVKAYWEGDKELLLYFLPLAYSNIWIMVYTLFRWVGLTSNGAYLASILMVFTGTLGGSMTLFFGHEFIRIKF